MIKLKLFAAAAAAVVSLGMAGTASAFTIFAGDIKISIDNFDAGTTGYGPGTPVCATVAACNASPGVTAAPGSGASGFDTMGIFSISSIVRISDNSTLFTKGPGDYLTGIFSELSDHTVNNFLPGIDLIQSRASGGGFKIFSNVVDYVPSLGPTGVGVDLTTYTYAGISGAPVWLEGIFVSGILAGDFTTTYRSIFDSTNTGQGAGFMNITGGSAEGIFAKGGVIDNNGTGRDLFTDITFNTTGIPAGSGWTVRSSGQVFGTVLPEPGSLALVGLGLLAAGAATRRKKA